VSDRIFWRGFLPFKQAALKGRNIPAQGNAPVWITSQADLAADAEKVVANKSFDCGDDDSIAVCRTILLGQGIGHTAIIHTQNEQQAQRYRLKAPVSRILINSGGSTGCIEIGTGPTPSLTLGCGTYGGNSTTDNVSYKQR